MHHLNSHHTTPPHTACTPFTLPTTFYHTHTHTHTFGLIGGGWWSGCLYSPYTFPTFLATHTHIAPFTHLPAYFPRMPRVPYTHPLVYPPLYLCLQPTHTTPSHFPTMPPCPSHITHYLRSLLPQLPVCHALPLCLPPLLYLPLPFYLYLPCAPYAYPHLHTAYFPGFTGFVWSSVCLGLPPLLCLVCLQIKDQGSTRLLHTLYLCFPTLCIIPTPIRSSVGSAFIPHRPHLYTAPTFVPRSFVFYHHYHLYYLFPFTYHQFCQPPLGILPSFTPVSPTYPSVLPHY